MHVSSNDASHDGRTHIVTSVIEADGASELVRVDQMLSAEILSIKRTASGGIEMVSAIKIDQDINLPTRDAEEGDAA